MYLNLLQTFLLSGLILLVLILPITVKKIEENLEFFLFLCGIFAVTVSQTWSVRLLEESFTAPVKIAAAVLAAGFLFKIFHSHFQFIMQKTVKLFGFKLSIFLTIMILGIFSSIITAIISALILSQVAVAIPMSRRERIRFVVLSCYSIGLGAVLTSIGEPLGTIVISKLSGAPHYASFSFLIKHFGVYIFAGVLFSALWAVFGKHKNDCNETETAQEPEGNCTNKEVFLRAAKVYLFVMALVLLGDGLRPLAYKTVAHLHYAVLYWVNMVSAILDNATLAAIEITPDISIKTLKFLLMGLIVSGGMLIPGNIPNIICASKLKIKSKEWAKAALPFGFLTMFVYFITLLIFA
jgi:predicted cation transporter